MTGRKETIGFIQKEVRRLKEEEKIADLIKATRFDELAAIECRISSKVQSFVTTKCLELSDKEIEEGSCVALAIWLRCCVNLSDSYIFKDSDKFAYRLAEEGGDFGKNVAVQMLDGLDLCDIAMEEFFTTRYAEQYDGQYGLGVL